MVLKQSEDLPWRGLPGGSDRRGLSCRIEEYGAEGYRPTGQRMARSPMHHRADESFQQLRMAKFLFARSTALVVCLP